MGVDRTPSLVYICLLVSLGATAAQSDGDDTVSLVQGSLQLSVSDSRVASSDLDAIAVAGSSPAEALRTEPVDGSSAAAAGQLVVSVERLTATVKAALSSTDLEAETLRAEAVTVKEALLGIVHIPSDMQHTAYVGNVTEALDALVKGWDTLSSAFSKAAPEVVKAAKRAGQHDMAAAMAAALNRTHSPMSLFAGKLASARVHLDAASSERGETRVNELRELNRDLEAGVDSLLTALVHSNAQAFRFFEDLDSASRTILPSSASKRVSLACTDVQQYADALAKHMVAPAQVLVSGVELATAIAAPEALEGLNAAQRSSAVDGRKLQLGSFVLFSLAMGFAVM